MQVSLEKASEIRRKMTVVVPAEEFEKAISGRLHKIGGSVRLPGFRPGKVPRKILETRFGKQASQEAAADLIETSLRKALKQENLIPAGGSEIEPLKMERGADLEFIADFDVYPSIPVLELEGRTLEKPVCEVTESDIDATLATIRKQRRSWTSREQAAELGDKLIIDFSGSINGELFEGGSAENYSVEIGSGQVLPDLENGLVGLEAGQEKTIEVNFPEDYQGQEVAGKKALFVVKVHEVQAAELPEMNEDFVRLFGVDDGQLASLRQEVKDNLQREYGERIRQTMRDRVMQELLVLNPIELPRRLVAEEQDRILQSSQREMEQAGMPASQAPEREMFAEEASRRVRLGLILREIIRVNALKVDPERVQARLTGLAANYEDPESFISWHYQDKDRLAQVEAMVMEEQVIEKMLEQADVDEVNTPFSEFMATKTP